MLEAPSNSSIRSWRAATVLRATKAADDIMSIELRPDDWLPHKAGQHYELRLPGHHLSRKYSIVSSPHQTDRLEFGVQFLSYGEVSPLLWKLRSGDKLEIRGPLGAFVWTPEMTGPLILIAAGSGITPFLSMYDYYRHANPNGKVVLIVSAKDKSRVMHYGKYKDDIICRFTTTEGRIDRAFLERAVGEFAADSTARCLTCGPGGFTGGVIDMLLHLGFTEAQVQRETFN